MVLIQEERSAYIINLEKEKENDKNFFIEYFFKNFLLNNKNKKFFFTP
jgi:hypothetical protein